MKQTNDNSGKIHFGRMFGVQVLVFGVCLILSTLNICEAGITYFPGKSRVEVKNAMDLEFSLAVLSWELPGGLLVADRMTPPGFSRFGSAFQPYNVKSEWFIVRISKGGTIPTKISFTDYGQVHLRDSGFVLLEVFPHDFNKFAACPYEKQRIPQDPPPKGSERYPAEIRSLLREQKTQGKNPEFPVTIQDFLGRGNEVFLKQVHQEITGFAEFNYQGNPYTVSTRYYSSSDKTLVADYLGNKLNQYGYTVQYETFTVGSVSCRNVVATLSGTTLPDEYVIVGGHYDSTSEQASTLAPGADDNGSGTALVMEIARMAADFEFERSIQFVLFDSEEQGLNGSYNFVSNAVGSGRIIVAAIIADMVTYYSNNYGVLIEGETEWESLMTIMENSTANYTTLKSRKDYYSWGSDHVPFQQAGIPAFLAIEWDWSSYPAYHTSLDNWEHVEATADIGFEISQACAAALAEVAGLQLSAVPTLSFPFMSIVILLLSFLMFAWHRE